MASMPATMSMASPWKGCSRSATQSCKPWGESGGAGCPQPTMGTHSWVPQQPCGEPAHPGTPVGAIPPGHWVLAGGSRAGRGPARHSWDP